MAFIEKWLNLNREHEEFRDRALIFLALSFLILIFGLFLYYNIFIVPFPFMIAINGVGFLASLIGLWVLKSHRNPRIAGLIVVTTMTVVSLLYICKSVSTHNDEFALGFTLAIPVAAIFILGYRLGTLVSLFNFGLVFFICFKHLTISDIKHPHTLALIHLAVIYITLLLMVFFYDSVRQQTLQRLLEANGLLKKLSTTDVLTQLPNRFSFEELVKGSQSFFWIAMIDIDDFKKINDTLGHDHGDKVLQILADTIKAAIGSNGIACRWGGEEFMVAFSVAELSEVEKMVTQLQQSLLARAVAGSAPITVSCGIAAYQADHYHYAFKQADAALYMVKQRGKNGYKVYHAERA